MRRLLMGATLAVALVLAGPLGAAGQSLDRDGGLEVGAHAREILREMSDYLATAAEMTFEAEVSYDALTEGQLLQFGGVSRLALRRPDGLRRTARLLRSHVAGCADDVPAARLLRLAFQKLGETEVGDLGDQGSGISDQGPRGHAVCA